MNKTYLTVWNESTGTWVAASEITKSQGKASHSSLAAASISTVSADSGEKSNHGVIRRTLIAIAISMLGLGTAQFANAQTVLDNGTGTVSTTAAATNTGDLSVGDFTFSQGAATPAAAFGYGSSANGGGALAMGTYAIAGTDYAIAIGQAAQATQLNTVAVGVNAAATGGQAVAIGIGSQASGNNSYAMGNAALALGGSSIAQGVGAEAWGG